MSAERESVVAAADTAVHLVMDGRVGKVRPQSRRIGPVAG
jgi:hypothetical protein